jgi:hypothetical protein
MARLMATIKISNDPSGWSAPPITLAKNESMAQPNYQYEKRQKELAKKKKKEEKSQRKSADKETHPLENETPVVAETGEIVADSKDEEKTPAEK